MKSKNPISISIRNVCLDDAAPMLEIYAPNIEISAISFEEKVPSIAEFRERIRMTTQAYPWLVAVGNSGEVKGYAYASRHRERPAYRWAVEVSVYVHEKFRGQGVANKLYLFLLASLREQNYVQAYAGITLPNEASVRLHESFSFKQIAIYEKIGYKFGSWRDVGWWRLELNQPDLGPGNPPQEPRPFRGRIG